jgi:hypothetical protein
LRAGFFLAARRATWAMAVSRAAYPSIHRDAMEVHQDLAE